MTTIILHDPLCAGHDTGDHPESAARIEAVVKALKEQGLWSRCAQATRSPSTFAADQRGVRPSAPWRPLRVTASPTPRVATAEELALVHTRAYIEEVRELSQRGGGLLDPDTVVSPGSYDAAARAAGLVLQGVDRIIEGKARNGLVLARPPGHHAFPARGSGFCIFNNVAVGARYVREKKRLARVLIVDWDVHHGNGTQEIFYRDPSVMYVSAHAYPFYPGSGSADERGAGAGEGYTINLPMTRGIGAQIYLDRVRQVLRGPAAEFRPEFVLVSAGFDAVAGDPVGGLDLTADSFATLTHYVMELAEECCNGRLLSVLEGGYDLTLLPECVAAHLSALLSGEGEGKR